MLWICCKIVAQQVIQQIHKNLTYGI